MENIFLNNIYNTINKIAKYPKLSLKLNSGVEELKNIGIQSSGKFLQYIATTFDDSLARYISLWYCGRVKNKKKYTKSLLDNFSLEKKKKWLMEISEVLILIESKKAVVPLINIMMGDDLEDRREAAAYALTYLYDKRASEPFLNIIKNNSNRSSIRVQAIEGVGNLMYSPAIPLLKKLLKDKNIDIKFACIKVLGFTRKKSVIPYLDQVVKIDNDAYKGSSLKEEALNSIFYIKNGYFK